jgi:DNA-binding MarR family transcriptional regulator
MVIGQVTPINSRELSKHMDVAASTISVYIRRLTQKGLVRMERNQDDRRNWWLHLTETGQDVYQLMVEGTVRYTHDFLSALSETEQQTLHNLLQKAAHALGYSWQ